MAPQRKFLDELDTSSKSYKVKVNIAEKGRKQESEKKIFYQYIVLEDDKKNRMKMTLFGDQIDAYKDVILFRGNYEIANALIRPLDLQYRNRETDLPFQMTIGSRTLIQCLDPEGQQSFPRYQSLASIPKVSLDDSRHDILVIVLYVAKEPRKIVTSLNKEAFVRDLIVIDHSTDQSMKVCTWNDLSGRQCEDLVSDADNFKVVGITALRPITRKGFQLESTMSTVIIQHPEGEKAAALTEWARKHRFALSDHQNRVAAAWNPPAERTLTTIGRIKTKKATTTLPQEMYWLRVVVSDIQYDRLRTYVGCSYCGKRTHHPLGTIYTCLACDRKEIFATHRATITLTFSDGTGALPLTAFTENCIPLFGLSAEQIYHMKETDDTAKFRRIADKLSTTYFLIKIGPTTALEQNTVLQWGLKAVEMEDTVTPDAAGSSSTSAAAGSETKNVAAAANAEDVGSYQHNDHATQSKDSLSKMIKKETVAAYDSSIFSQEEEDACLAAEAIAEAEKAATATATAEKSAESNIKDVAQKRKRTDGDDQFIPVTPAKDVIGLIATSPFGNADLMKQKEKNQAVQEVQKGKEIDYETPVGLKEKDQAVQEVQKGKETDYETPVGFVQTAKAIKQEKDCKRRALVFPDDDSDGN